MLFAKISIFFIKQAKIVKNGVSPKTLQVPKRSAIKEGLMVKCTPIIVELSSVYRGCKPLICFQ